MTIINALYHNLKKGKGKDIKILPIVLYIRKKNKLFFNSHFAIYNNVWFGGDKYGRKSLFCFEKNVLPFHIGVSD